MSDEMESGARSKDTGGYPINSPIATNHLLMSVLEAVRALKPAPAYNVAEQMAIYEEVKRLRAANLLQLELIQEMEKYSNVASFKKLKRYQQREPLVRKLIEAIFRPDSLAERTPERFLFVVEVKSGDCHAIIQAAKDVQHASEAGEP